MRSLQKEKACGYQQKRGGSCFTSGTQAPVTTGTTTWTFSPSPGLTPVSAHHPPLPKAGTQEFSPHTPPPPVALGPVRPDSLPHHVWNPEEGTSQPVGEQRKPQTQPLSTTSQEPHSPSSQRLGCLACVTLGTDVCSEDRDARAGLISLGAVTLS